MKKILSVILVFTLCILSLFAADANRPSVALVLSGGGAKGIAHIAVLQKIEELGIPVDKVYGTSMGALIGGIYSAGYSPNDLAHLVLDNDLAPMFTTLESSGYHELLNPGESGRTTTFSIAVKKGGYVGTSGLVDDYQIMNFFNMAIGNVPDDIDFEKDLVLPFNCNAANMIDGSEYIFDSGNLITAMRASMSIPLLFNPVFMEDGAVLMDGGVVSNRIVHKAIQDGYDIIICVSFVDTEKVDRTAENYKSLSKSIGGTVDVVLNNISKGEAENATVHIPIDITGYGALDFDKGVTILQRGYDQIEEQKDKLESIAALFSEEQKEYKDPNRVGEYFSKYEKDGNEKKYKASVLAKKEKSYQNSRFGLGLLGSVGLEARMGSKDTEELSTSLRGRVFVMASPKLNLNLFMKNIKGSQISQEIQATFDIPTEAFIKGTTLLQFTPNSAESIYAFLEANTHIGSLTYNTDPYTAVGKISGTEYKIGSKLGIKVTDEISHNFVLCATADMLWPLFDILDATWIDNIHTFCFYPKVEAGLVFYSKQSGDIFGEEDSRLDFVGRIGKVRDYKTYRFGVSGEKDFTLSDKSSMWIDFTAHTSREPYLLKDSYVQYGGWDGVPGYLSNFYCRDVIYGGMGYMTLLRSGIVKLYFVAQARAGLRSGFDYLSYQLVTTEQNMIPFIECFSEDRVFDIGATVGIGLGMPTGSHIVFGVGLNSKLRGSVYLELK